MKIKNLAEAIFPPNPCSEIQLLNSGYCLLSFLKQTLNNDLSKFILSNTFERLVSQSIVGGIKKNEIELESENSLKMNQLKDVKDIPKMYYSVVTDDEYNKYIENEIKKMLAKKDRSEMTEFELKAEAGLKKLFKEKK